jgi:glycosyltransferase involved in cell wall biosynthesis
MKSSRIKLLFDAGPLANGQKSGVGYYTYRLVDALARYYPDKLDMTGHYFNFLGRKKPKLPDYPNLSFRSSLLLPGKVLSALRRIGGQLPFDLLIKTRGDIALFPNFVSLPTLQKTKKVVVIHDLAFADQPEFLQPSNLGFLRRFVPKSLRSADLVVAVSQFTKKRITQHYKIPAEKIIVTPIPPEQPTTKIAAKPSFELPPRFILFISTLEPRKNFINLIKAYSLLPANVKNKYGLVLAGGMGWQAEKAMDLVRGLQSAGEAIYVTGYINDSDKTYLYQHASLLVMPSHYEGFGMPILEAMSYGVPTAVSDIEVFHETAAEATVYFDKDNPDDIAKSMAKILTSPQEQARLAKLGRERSKYFSWEANAHELMKALEKLISRAR